VKIASLKITIINGNLTEPALIDYEFGLMLPFAINLRKKYLTNPGNDFLAQNQRQFISITISDVVNDLFKT